MLACAAYLGCLVVLLQAAQAQVQEAEVALKAVKAELQHTKQQATQQHACLEEQLADVKQQLQRSVTEGQLQVSTTLCTL